MADVFISYAREDKERADELAGLLTDRGWDVWWDRELIAGTEYDSAIEAQLEQARAVVVLWSPASIGSRWVKTEANVGLQRGILVPVLVAGTDVPLAFQLVHNVELTGWTGSPDDPRLAPLFAAIARVAPLPEAAPRPDVVPAPPPAPPPSPPPTDHGQPWRRWLPWALGTAAVVVVLGAAVAVIALSGGDGESEATDTTTATETTTATTEPGGEQETTAAAETSPEETAPPEPECLGEGNATTEANPEIWRLEVLINHSPRRESPIGVDGVWGPTTATALVGVAGTTEVCGPQLAELQAAVAGYVPVPELAGTTTDEVAAELEAAGFPVERIEGCADRSELEGALAYYVRTAGEVPLAVAVVDGKYIHTDLAPPEQPILVPSAPCSLG